MYNRDRLSGNYLKPAGRSHVSDGRAIDPVAHHDACRDPTDAALVSAQLCDA